MFCLWSFKWNIWSSYIYHNYDTLRFKYIILVVPNLFGTRDKFLGRQFFHGSGGRAWFWDDANTLRLLCILFLSLLHQLHLRSSGIRSQRLGTPVLSYSLIHICPTGIMLFFPLPLCLLLSIFIIPFLHSIGLVVILFLNFSFIAYHI